jgi:hypothetical protein
MSPCVALELTRWTRGLPAVTQQVNMFSAIRITQKCFTIYKNIPSVIIPVVNQINPVDLLTSYASKIHFNVILSCSLQSYTLHTTKPTHFMQEDTLCYCFIQL